MAAAEREISSAHLCFVQEHKIVDDAGLDAARGQLAKLGYEARFSKAVRTELGGRSCGTALLLGTHWDFVAELRPPKGLEHRATGAIVKLKGVELQAWSVYGHDRDPVVTRQLVLEVVQAASSELPLLVGGDFNAEPADVELWLQPFPAVEVAPAGGPTCHVGTASSELDFFVASRSILHALAGNVGCC